jgi:hypothetical protein
MNRITSFLARVLITGMIVLGGNSCVKESYDRCLQSVRLYLSLAPDASTRGIRPGTTISRIDVYAFDEADRFVGYWFDDSVVMSEDYYISLDGLAAGTYSLVAWSNIGERYRTSVTPDDPREPRGTRRITLDLPENRELRDVTLPSLYFGEYRGARVSPYKINRIDMPVDDNRYSLHFKAEGIAPDDDTYAFIVTDNNGSYSFDNDYTGMSPFKYIATARFGESPYLNASMTVLRLDQYRSPALEFINERTGDRYFSCANLVELILQANSQGAGIDFRETRDINILLRVYANAEVVVSINGWEIKVDDTQVS